MAVARREVLEMVRGLAERFPDYGVEGEVYVTAPGAEIEEGHELVAAIDAAHAEVFGETPERDVTRWFSDASALTRYGVPTVNYGTSTGLMDVELGENLEIDGAREDGGGLRPGRDGGLRCRMTCTRCRRTCRCRRTTVAPTTSSGSSCRPSCSSRRSGRWTSAIST